MHFRVKKQHTLKKQLVVDVKTKKVLCVAIGKKALLTNPDLEVVALDASERPVERPKKNNDLVTVVKRSDPAR